MQYNFFHKNGIIKASNLYCAVPIYLLKNMQGIHKRVFNCNEKRLK